MSSLTKIAVGGILLLVGLLMFQGFGTELGVLQTSSDYSERVPELGNDTWNETGTLSNLVTSNDALLTINDTTTTASDTYLNRFYADSQGEWNTSNADITRMTFLNNTYGDYLTKQEANTGQSGLYNSQQFHAESGNITINYRYQELENPSSFSLTLYNTDTGTESDTIELNPGTEQDNFSVTETMEINSSGSHEIRLELSGGTYDEQRLYSLNAEQNSSQISLGQGVYTTDELQVSDSLRIENINFEGTNIQHRKTTPQRIVRLTFTGYDDGVQVAEESFTVKNTPVRTGEVFDEELVKTFSFEAELITETGSSPQLEYVEIEGSTQDRVANKRVTDLLQTFIFVLVMGLGLLYMASGIKN